MEQVLAQTDLNVRPFVSERVHYTIKDGMEVVVVRETVARSRSGAIVHAGNLHDPKTGKTFNGLRRIEYPDGLGGLIIDSIQGKSTGHKPEAVVAAQKLALQNALNDCAEPPFYFVDGEETLYAQKAVRVIGPKDDQALTRFILWRLPDYNCETVQATVQQRSSPTAQWQTIAGSHLIKFVEMDPDPTLFSGFASYKEMPPSALMKQFAAQQGLAMPTAKDCPKCSKSDAAMDQVYSDWNK
jgi:hypothetical protein